MKNTMSESRHVGGVSKRQERVKGKCELHENIKKLIVYRVSKCSVLSVEPLWL